MSAKTPAMRAGRVRPAVPSGRPASVSASIQATALHAGAHAGQGGCGMRVGLRKFWPLAVLCGHTSVSCCPDTGVIRVTNCQVVHAVHDWQAS